MSQAVSLAVSSPFTPLKQEASPVLPDDLVSHALCFLSPEDLARASGVCREWSTIASGLWKEFDLKKICKVIDQAVWEKHVDLATLGLDVSGASVIDKRVAIPFLKRLSSQVERNAGVTLLTMPKGLTLNKLMALAAAPKQGPATQFKFVWSRIEQVLKNVAVAKTFTVAITNSVLKGSRSKTFSEQRALAQKNGGELPGILPAATLAILTYVNSPEGQPPIRLYSNEPWTCTRCSEELDELNLGVGGFALTGLDVDGCHGSISDHSRGAAVARRFQ